MAALAHRAGRRLAPAALALLLVCGSGAAATAQAPPAAGSANDAKLVEYEVSEAVVERLMKWAQWFGLAVGLPLAALALILTVLGVRSYRDLQQRLTDARAEVDQRMAEALELKGEFDALRLRYAQLAELEQSVRAIAGRVERIEEVVGFQKSKALTPKLQASLQDSLRRYRAWLAGLGVDTDEPVTVAVTAKDLRNAHYDAGRIEIDKRLAGDPDVVMREYTHHVLKTLRPEGEALEFGAVQSGLSDYLPCSFKDAPQYAPKAAAAFNRMYRRKIVPEGYVRTMVNDRRLDTGGELHDVGEAWGGAFWELRELLASQVADRLLLEAWKEAPVIADTPAAQLAFAKRVCALAARRKPSSEAKAAAIFARRGLAVRRPARRRAAA
jgi:hypothetical protein